jgi:phospholipid/cholesterol/gamma-HCH transport system ATP-binding protein
VRDLRVQYGEREILHGINFDVEHAQTLVILGGSGSGKSTLLRTLVGLERPSAGQVWMKGQDLAKTSRAEMDEIRKKIGMSFQGGALFGSMTVGENVALPLREHTNLEDSTIEIIVRLKLDQVGLAGFEYYMPSELSGGMKKRVSLARALVMDPELILFDEPVAGLDPVIASVIDELIISLSEKSKVTSIIVTHEMGSAFRIGTRMAMLYQGKIIEDAPPEQFKQSTNPVVAQFLSGSTEGPILEGSQDAIATK